MTDIEDIPKHANAMVTLVLANQNLSKIPTHLPLKTKQLKHLDISNNKITKLPKSVYHWQQLTSFIAGNLFGGNLLSDFPPTSTFPNLRVLDLSHNQLKHIVIDSYLYIANLQFNHLNHICLAGRVHTLNIKENQFKQLGNINADIIDITNNPLSFIPFDLTKKHLICTHLKEQAPLRDKIVPFSLQELCARQLDIPSKIKCTVCSRMIREYHSIYLKRVSLPVEFKCCSFECIAKIKPHGVDY